MKRFSPPHPNRMHRSQTRMGNGVRRGFFSLPSSLNVESMLFGILIMQEPWQKSAAIDNRQSECAYNISVLYYIGGIGPMRGVFLVRTFSAFSERRICHREIIRNASMDCHVLTAPWARLICARLKLSVRNFQNISRGSGYMTASRGLTAKNRNVR